MKDKELLKKIIEKQDEYIEALEKYIKYPETGMKGHNELLDQLASLKSQLREQQCHSIYEKVKESWTPDKRSFEEAEAESQLSAHVTMDDLRADDKAREGRGQKYHLNCDRCGEPFWSNEAFPEPHICPTCYV